VRNNNGKLVAQISPYPRPGWGGVSPLAPLWASLHVVEGRPSIVGRGLPTSLPLASFTSATPSFSPGRRQDLGVNEVKPVASSRNNKADYHTYGVVNLKRFCHRRREYEDFEYRPPVRPPRTQRAMPSLRVQPTLRLVHCVPRLARLTRRAIGRRLRSSAFWQLASNATL
jgi:hypothetical protein